MKPLSRGVVPRAVISYKRIQHFQVSCLGLITIITNLIRYVLFAFFFLFFFFCFVFFFCSRPCAEYNSLRFLTANHHYRVHKFLIDWFADAQNIFTEKTSILKRIFSPGYPCVNSTLMCNFPNPSPLMPLI